MDELDQLNEFADELAELYPGECPSLADILVWVKEIKEKAHRFDSLNLYRGRS